MTIANILSIAGSDPSGGAGIQADLKTFSACGAYGMAALAALTAQNTRGVTGVEAVSPDFVEKQIDTVFADVRVDAVKIGMLASADVVRAVARSLTRNRATRIVLDPVMVAKGGDRLLAAEAVAALRDELLPLAGVITPNLPEAAVLLDEPEAEAPAAMEAAANRLLALGCGAVLVKGGHLQGNEAPDVLATPSGLTRLESDRVSTENTHGTGCTLSSAVAAHWARSDDLAAACREAKRYVHGAIAAADRLDVGGGHGPTHHFHAWW